MVTLNFKNYFIVSICTLVSTDIGWLYQSMKTQRLLTIKCHPKSGTRSTCCFDLRHKKNHKCGLQKIPSKNLSQFTCMCMPDLVLSGYSKWYVQVHVKYWGEISVKVFCVKYAVIVITFWLCTLTAAQIHDINNQIYM